MKFDYSTQLQQNNANPRATEYQAKRQLALLLPYLAGDKQKTILEIGPGAGLTLALLAREGYGLAEGVEGDAVVAAQALAAGVSVHHVPHEGVIAHIASRAGHYDLIFCIHVIEHIPVDAQLDFVRAIGAALRPGGYFICETPNALGVAALYYRYGDWTHTSLFTAGSLAFLLRNADLEVVYAGGAGDSVPPLGNPLATWLQRTAATTLRLISRGIIWRFMLFAELGPLALKLPLHAALRAVGRKSYTVSPQQTARSIRNEAVSSSCQSLAVEIATRSAAQDSLCQSVTGQYE